MIVILSDGQFFDSEKHTVTSVVYKELCVVITFLESEICPIKITIKEDEKFKTILRENSKTIRIALIQMVILSDGQSFNHKEWTVRHIVRKAPYVVITFENSEIDPIKILCEKQFRDTLLNNARVVQLATGKMVILSDGQSFNKDCHVETIVWKNPYVVVTFGGDWDDHIKILADRYGGSSKGPLSENARVVQLATGKMVILDDGQSFNKDCCVKTVVHKEPHVVVTFENERIDPIKIIWHHSGSVNRVINKINEATGMTVKEISVDLESEEEL